jgi:hypothetical protein
MGYHSLDALLDVQVTRLPDTEDNDHPGTLHYRMFFGYVSDPIRNDEVGGYIDESNMMDLANKFWGIAYKLHEHALKLQQHRLQLPTETYEEMANE